MDTIKQAEHNGTGNDQCQLEATHPSAGGLGFHVVLRGVSNPLYAEDTVRGAKPSCPLPTPAVYKKECVVYLVVHEQPPEIKDALQNPFAILFSDSRPETPPLSMPTWLPPRAGQSSLFCLFPTDLVTLVF